MGTHTGASERLEEEESFVYLVKFAESIGISGLFDQLGWVYD
jgi:hypothetical protein